MFDFAGRPLRAIHTSWRSIDTALLIMRAALGVAFVAHGGQKLFAWFGGGGITGTTAYFNSQGLPAAHAFTYISGILEFFGGIVIALGFLAVPAAFALAVEMIIAVAAVSFKAGFFVTAQKIGWELNVYLLGLLLAVMITGPGAWSLDAALGLTRRRSTTAGPAAARRAGQRSASVLPSGSRPVGAPRCGRPPDRGGAAGEDSRPPAAGIPLDSAAALLAEDSSTRVTGQVFCSVGLTHWQ